MNIGDRFRAAVEAGDLDAMIACLSPDVVFHTPVRFHGVEGKDAAAQILRVVTTVLEDFVYIDHATSPGLSILRFTARVGERSVEGVDILREAPDGLIGDFTVMARPLSGLTALAEAMGRGLGILPAR